MFRRSEVRRFLLREGNVLLRPGKQDVLRQGGRVLQRPLRVPVVLRRSQPMRRSIRRRSGALRVLPARPNLDQRRRRQSVLSPGHACLARWPDQHQRRTMLPGRFVLRGSLLCRGRVMHRRPVLRWSPGLQQSLLRPGSAVLHESLLSGPSRSLWHGVLRKWRPLLQRPARTRLSAAQLLLKLVVQRAGPILDLAPPSCFRMSGLRSPGARSLSDVPIRRQPAAQARRTHVRKRRAALPG
jgi:hypothetical protein